jgi:hypothetical protein
MPDPKVQHVLDETAQWPEERFYSDDLETRRRIEWELAQAKDSGYWTAAPKKIAVEKRGSLPLLLMVHFTALREWEVSEEANAILIASALSGSPIEPCFAFPSSKRWRPGEWGSRHGDPPAADEQKIFTSQLRTLDARGLCNIPWQAGRVAITYMAYDWRAPTVITELTGPPVESKPIPADRAAAFRRSLFPDKLVMGQFPAYVSSQYHPEVSGQGIGLRVPGKIKASAKNIPALGTARIPLPAHTMVDSADPDFPAALIPAEILVLQLDNPHRGVIPLNIPVYARPGQKLRTGDVAEAHFAIDLFRHIQPSLEPGEYLCYLVVQEHISDPVKIMVE